LMEYEESLGVVCGAVTAGTWWRRYEAVGLALMNQHLKAKQHAPALQWLRILERRRRGDPQVLSMVGYVQMMVGDLAAAEEMFHRVAAQGTPRAEALTGRNRSLLLFARRKFREAQEDLQVCVCVCVFVCVNVCVCGCVELRLNQC
jgi:predicted Zn-dependent protease